MILKCVIFIIINVVSCMRSIQKIPPKYNTASSNPDLTKLALPSDKNSFPDVVYPTSIFDINNPFYFNTDNNYEVLGPFSEDVKSSYKLLSSFMKSTPKNLVENVKSQMEINEFVTTPATDDVNIVSVHENITEDCHNDSQDNCVNAKVIERLIETQNSTDSILGDIAPNFDIFHNISLPQEIKNESCSKIPLLVKINIQIFNERSNKSTEEKVIGIPNNLSSPDNEENPKHLKQVTDTLSNESSEEINSSSEEHYTELQDIKHSDFIKIISAMLLDLLVSTENVTSAILNPTSIENELLERMVLESVDSLANLERFGSMESKVTDLKVNGTQSDFDFFLNSTEPLNLKDLTVFEIANDFENLLSLTESSNLTVQTVNGTYNDFENLLKSTEPLNLTDLPVYETHNDFENWLIFTVSPNLTDQTVNGTHNEFEISLKSTEPLNLTDLPVYETHNDFENLLIFTISPNLTDQTVNGTHNDFENLLKSTEPLNLTDLPVYETHNDFENLLIFTVSPNLTDQTVNGTRNDFENLLNFTEPLNLTVLTVNEAYFDFENLLNLTEPLNLTVLTVNDVHFDFENFLNLTEPLNLTDGSVYNFDNLLNLTESFTDSDGESSKGSKEDYFLEFLISLDSLCDNHKTLEIVADSEYLTNHKFIL